MVSRRGLFKRVLAALGAYGLGTISAVAAVPAEITVPSSAPEQKFDFEARGIEGWTVVQGQWAVEDMPGTSKGRKALLQRATEERVQRDRGAGRAVQRSSTCR